MQTVQHEFRTAGIAIRHATPVEMAHRDPSLAPGSAIFAALGKRLRH